MPSTFYFIHEKMVETCRKEYEDFIKQNNDTINTLDKLDSSYISLLTLSNDTSIGKIKEKMSITDTSKYDYHSMILTLEPHNKNTLWLYRNVLFYYVFLYVNDLLQNPKKLSDFYINNSPARLSKEYLLVGGKSPIEKDDLKKYKISNFGSATPTSDIDASIQYDGEGDPHVSFLLSLIEDTYLYLFGISCLQLDIEFYDSYISKCVSIKDTNPTPPCKETYIVDGRIDKGGYDRLLEYAAASMIRNVYIALNDNAECKTLLRSRQDNTSQHNPQFIGLFDYASWQTILQQISPKSFNDEPTNTESRPEYVVQLTNMLSEIGKHDHVKAISDFCMFFYNQLFIDNSDITSSFTNAQNKVTNYFYNTTDNKIKSYDAQRKLYYDDLLNSEKAIKTQSNDIIPRIVAFSESQIYRQEGYVCVLTVMHIPRYYQKCGIQQGKKNTNISGCSETCDIDESLNFEIPACLLDDYAYKISMVEQLGFMLRFAVSYILSIHQLSIDHANDIESNEKPAILKKYTEKINKYKKRYDHAHSKMSKPNIHVTNGVTNGGKRRSIRRKSNRRNSTLRIRRKRNFRKTQKPRKPTKN